MSQPIKSRENLDIVLMEGTASWVKWFRRRKGRQAAAGVEACSTRGVRPDLGRAQCHFTATCLMFIVCICEI
ncbi:hypothetical protein ATANTOWER_013015 [Ataeniobius toweri]|uniref:Uncharacterized protein n=1 Tax=Ataeniobius toweri TaxID=208326 RepID=A0ABU7AEV7_9TELE|nr:hypothetical protein [Ataeniobius toweri]